MACSGGADSLALTLLARDWACSRGGSVVALVVDHGLRAEAAEEADWTCRTLAARGIAARRLRLEGLSAGSRLAERARRARYAALEGACAESGIVHLLLGHHAGDQAETLAMRMLRGSGPDGLACMPALAETAWVRLLRPLLAVAPGRLRATLRAAGVEWIEDPSNRNPATLRARLRALRRDPGGDGPATRAAVEAAAARGVARARRDAEDAGWLGRHARLDPAGHAVLDALPDRPGPLAALLRIVAGAERPPRRQAVAAWLAAPRAATLHGVILRPAGRPDRGGWLLCREPAAMAPGVPAHPGATWDGRFRLLGRFRADEQGADERGADAGCPTLGPARPLSGRVLDRTRPGVYPERPGARLCWWPPAPACACGFVAAVPWRDLLLSGV